MKIEFISLDDFNLNEMLTEKLLSFDNIIDVYHLGASIYITTIDNLSPQQLFELGVEVHEEYYALIN